MNFDIPNVELTLEIDPMTVFQAGDTELAEIIQRNLIAHKFDLSEGAPTIRQHTDVTGRMFFHQTRPRSHVSIPYVKPGLVLPSEKMETVLRANQPIFTSEQRMVKQDELFIYEGQRMPRTAIAEVVASQSELARLRVERDAYFERCKEVYRKSGIGVQETSTLAVPDGELVLPSTFEILMHGVMALLYAGAKGFKKWLHQPSKFCFCERCVEARQA